MATNVTGSLWRRWTRAAVVLPIAAATAMLAGASPQAPVSTARPRLVVLLVVDQMRADYIERYGHAWTGGLRRLLDRGAWFSRAAYPYYSTVTCVGHATIGTGSLPSTHGMILNEWWDRATGRRLPCTADETTTVVGHGRELTGRGDSARALRSTTLAEVMRTELDPPARVLSFSLKARSAIGMAGRRGDAVVWFDGRGAFVTSTAFAAVPVPAVAEFVARRSTDADFGRVWERMLPVDRYLFESPAVGARPASNATPAFPHKLAGPAELPDRAYYSLWQDSPFADAYLAEMALHVARSFGAGAASRTDFLGVSFSALDLVGHDFGPRSHEVQDILLRLDATIGTLLDGLDALVGAGNYVVALSADHGVAPIPEYAAGVGLAAGRRTNAAVSEAIEAALAPLGPGPHVAAALYSDVYLTEATWAALRDRPDLIRTVKARLTALDGVTAVFTRDEIEANRFMDVSIGQRMARGYFPGRSGDLLIANRAYWISSSDATTHGTSHDYDARVPLILMGPAITPGQYLDVATPADIAPTLAHIVGVTLPQAQGRVLSTAIRSSIR